MANTKISGLPSAASLTGVELLPAVQSGSTTQATVNQVKTYVNTTPAITGGSINSTPIGATTPSTGAFTTLVGNNGASIKGTVNPASGQSVEIYHSGSVGQIYSYDRTGSAWLPLLVYGSTVALYGSNVLGLTVASGGRVLVGTSIDDGVNALQVNGYGIFAGLIKPQQATTAGAPAYVKGAIYFDTTLNNLRVG